MTSNYHRVQIIDVTYSEHGKRDIRTKNIYLTTHLFDKKFDGSNDGWDDEGYFVFKTGPHDGTAKFVGDNKGIRDHADEGWDILLWGHIQNREHSEVKLVGNFIFDEWFSFSGSHCVDDPSEPIFFRLHPVAGPHSDNEVNL